MGNQASDLEALQERTFARATATTRDAYPPRNRLSGDALARYLDRRVYGVVCSSRPAGRPHATPTSYVRRGSTFWMATVAGSVRERNIAVHPWLVLVVNEGDRGEHIVVILEGPAAIVSPDDVPAGVTAEIKGDWVSVWVRLDAERLLSYAANRSRFR